MCGRLRFGARSTTRSTRVSVPLTSVSRVTRVTAAPLAFRLAADRGAGLFAFAGRPIGTRRATANALRPAVLPPVVPLEDDFLDFAIWTVNYPFLTTPSIRRTSTTRSSGRHGLVTNESHPAFFAPSDAP